MALPTRKIKIIFFFIGQGLGTNDIYYIVYFYKFMGTPSLKVLISMDHITVCLIEV